MALMNEMSDEIPNLKGWDNAKVCTRTSLSYNPEKNLLSCETATGGGEGWVDIGFGKLAEAISTLDKDMRPEFWEKCHHPKAKYFNGIPVGLMSSRIRHRLNKVGIYSYPIPKDAYYHPDNRSEALRILGKFT